MKLEIGQRVLVPLYKLGPWEVGTLEEVNDALWPYKLVRFKDGRSDICLERILIPISEEATPLQIQTLVGILK